MAYTKIITSSPAVRSGKPCIRDTRMTVTDVLEYLAGGMSENEILRDFPYITREDIRAPDYPDVSAATFRYQNYSSRPAQAGRLRQ